MRYLRRLTTPAAKCFGHIKGGDRDGFPCDCGRAVIVVGVPCVRYGAAPEYLETHSEQHWTYCEDTARQVLGVERFQASLF
jgi:hypothetical protein